jgi:hypothetical protein
MPSICLARSAEEVAIAPLVNMQPGLSFEASVSGQPSLSNAPSGGTTAVQVSAMSRALALSPPRNLLSQVAGPLQLEILWRVAA